MHKTLVWVPKEERGSDDHASRMSYTKTLLWVSKEERAGATGSFLPVHPTRRFQAVKIRDCRLYAAKGWYEDLALPIIQSPPVAIP